MLNKLVLIRAPIIANYTLAANVNVLIQQSDLLTTGQKALKEDLEYYKILIEQYKGDCHEFKKEQLSL